MNSDIDCQYALIVGNGRSGTNWLLTILNASELTHCRNEPQHIANSPIHTLPTPQKIAAADPEMAQRWDAFVEWTVTHMGERDHPIVARKQYFYTMAQRLGLSTWPARPKIRRGLGFFLPRFRQGEWEMPGWIGSQTQLKKAYSILKLNDLPAWTVRWLLQHRPTVPIVHIVRHPGGQLNSGIKRFFSQLEPSEIESETRLYRDLLKTALQIDPEWEAAIRDIDSMDLAEAVAWFWRYNNEAIYYAGRGHQNYHCLIYENLAQNPIEIAKDIYKFCDIPWTTQVEAVISQNTRSSVWGKLPADSKTVSKAWRDRLSAKNQAIAERVLENSLLEAWWH